MASVREPDFDRLIIELETKSAQLVDGAKQGFQPSRSQLEDFVWKTGRVTRKLVEPERSEACKIFWSECKGILKDIIIVERFNPSVFFAECIRKDIVETNVVACLGKLISYTKRRKSGVITAPKEVLGPADPEAKKRKLDEEQEAAESKRKGKKGKGKGKKGKSGGKGKSSKSSESKGYSKGYDDRGKGKGKSSKGKSSYSSWDDGYSRGKGKSSYSSWDDGYSRGKGYSGKGKGGGWGGWDNSSSNWGGGYSSGGYGRSKGGKSKGYW